MTGGRGRDVSFACEDDEGFVMTTMRTGHWVELGAAENTESACTMTVNFC